MNSKLTVDLGHSLPTQMNRQDLGWLALILIFALTVRLIFFTGFFGSDEVTYLSMAHSITQNIWQSKENYIGTLRYGVNIPMAVFMWSFGTTEFAAGLWSLVTSVGEVALVFFAARQFWGSRAGVFAALCLAVTPLHAHFAGRLMADSPLAFFVTATFYLTWLAGHKQSVRIYLLAGLTAGALYWIKDAVFFISLFVLGIYVVVGRVWQKRWLISIIGVGVMVVANFVFMWVVYGDPFYVFHSGQQSLQGIASMPKSSPWFYINYLLLDIRHVWVLFYFASGGLAMLIKREGTFRSLAGANTFILIWFFGFLMVLSALVLRQPNYMLIFLAPLALLGGYFLSNLRTKATSGTVALFAVGGLALSALEQQAVEVFTANSRSTVVFAQLHAGSQVYGSTGATRADTYHTLLSSAPKAHPPILPLKKLESSLGSESGKVASASGSKSGFAVMDPQMLTWTNTGAIDWQLLLSAGCLVKHSNLIPAPLGLGRYVTDSIFVVTSFLPSSLNTRIREKLLSTLRPLPATVYSVELPCVSPKTDLGTMNGVK